MLNLKGQSAPQLLLNPRFNSKEKILLEHLSPLNLEDHFVILSSGTTSSVLKGYALSRSALLSNAQAVNDHFQLTKDDVWGLSLPSYHVGGLSVLARAHLLNNKVIRFEKWNPVEWVKVLDKEKITITTVVPTQVYDLVVAKLTPPKDLRYLVVGGDFLSEALEHKAMDLGWPVIRTFGMTEVCSQLASAHAPGEKSLSILPIHDVLTLDERLYVKGPALFTMEFKLDREFTAKNASDFLTKEGFFPTQDRVHLLGRTLVPLGRLDDQLKIAGRLTSLQTLREILSTYTLEHDLHGKIEIQAIPDDRKGHRLQLSYLEGVSLDRLSEVQELFSPIQFDVVTGVKEFQRTDLGKLKRGPIG